AQLEDPGLAVTSEVGRRFAGAGRRIRVRGEAARRLRGAQEPPHLRLADDDVRGRQVEQYLRAGRRAGRARRRRHPQILADLDMEGEAPGTAGGEYKVDPEGRLMQADGDPAAAQPFPRGEMAPLIEFAVVRQ